MTPFEPTDDQRAVGDLAREIAAREIAPHIAAWDREHTFPRALFTKFTDAGLMGLQVPEAYGGSAADYVSYALTIEEIARVDAGTATTLSVHSMICNAIAKLGTEEQRERWLPELATKDALAGFALTEPDAGSDAAAIRSRAVRDGDDYVLNGRKQWCTNGGYAAVVMAMFRTGDPGAHGISAFLIDMSLPGVEVEKVTEKLGIHTSNTVDLVFTDVRVPASARLGVEGTGFTSALATLGAGRIGIASQAVGILAACLDASVKFATERVAFGRKIGAFEGIAFKIAQMATDLDAARLADLSCRRVVRRRRTVHDRRRAKPSSSRRPPRARTPPKPCKFTAATATRPSFPVERYYRDAKITEIYEGTSEIQQVIISRDLVGRAGC